MIKIEGLKATINALKALEKDVNKKKEIEKDIRSASKSMVLAAKALAPVAEHTVKRYNNGKVVASYLPGNLKGSIKFIKSKSKEPRVLIGAKAGSGRSSTNPSSGIYGAGQFDGWYAHMVHEGTKFIKKTTPFLSSAFSSNKSSVEGKLGQFLLRKLKRSAKKFGFETL